MLLFGNKKIYHWLQLTCCGSVPAPNPMTLDIYVIRLQLAKWLTTKEWKQKCM
jgi:hypothetical protein